MEMKYKKIKDIFENMHISIEQWEMDGEERVLIVLRFNIINKETVSKLKQLREFFEEKRISIVAEAMIGTRYSTINEAINAIHDVIEICGLKPYQYRARIKVVNSAFQECGKIQLN
jgi:RNA-splicing ligase RtcB